MPEKTENTLSPHENEYCTYAGLIRDRRPSAFSSLITTEQNENADKDKNEKSSAKIEFFSTPRGIVINASLSGFSSLDDGYDACHMEIDGKRNIGKNEEKAYNYRARTSNLPPVFLRGGRGYVSFMTDRFTLCDIIGRKITLSRGGRQIASGFIKEASSFGN